MPSILSLQEIKARIKAGEAFMQPLVERNAAVLRNFKDPSFDSHGDGLHPSAHAAGGGFLDDDGPIDTLPVGVSNQVLVNHYIKMAAIAIHDPDFHVETQGNNKEKAEVSRQWLRSIWKLNNWRRKTDSALSDNILLGLGLIGLSWDIARGPRIDYIQSRNISVDPYLDDWQNLKYGARKIFITAREARYRYPEHQDLFAAQPANDPSFTDADAPDDLNIKDLYIYWDTNSLFVHEDGSETLGVEVHIFRDKELLRVPNLYEYVPIFAYEGLPDPANPQYPVGDGVLAAGAQRDFATLTQMISDKAKHGGTINTYVGSALTPDARDALENGQPQQWIAVTKNIPPAFARLPAEEITNAELDAKREASTNIDAIMGVGQYQRGVINQSVEFATEAALLQSQAGARGIQSRKSYEEFVGRLAKAIVVLGANLGGDYMDPDSGEFVELPDSENYLKECLEAVSDIAVVEGSTAYSDPSSDQQSGMSLLTLVLQVYQMKMQEAAMGMAVEVPNLKEHMDDVLRVFGKSDTARYWTPVQMPSPTMQPGGTDGESRGPREAASRA